MPKYIYYDGIGAKKSGKHTVKEFVKLMNTPENKEGCSRYLIGLGYKPCIKSRKLFKKLYGSTANLKGKARRERLQKSADALTKKCVHKMFNKKTLKSRKYKCDFEKFITYTGANFEEERK
jgi:hypothetical protein